MSPASFLAFVVPAACAPALLVAACTYDWSLGPVPGPDPAEGGAPDAAEAPDAAGAPDAGGAAEGGDAASQETCAAWLAALPEARERARRCTSSVAACTTDVVDECGCPFVVGQADSVAAADYKALAQQVRAAGCAVPGCGASCPTPRRGLCIVAEGGGTACAP